MKNQHTEERTPSGVKMSSKDIDYLKSNNIDIYDLLEVPKDAQDVAIRKAYRKQALVYHPDKNPSPSAADKFHAISISLKILSDKQLRNEYDSWLDAKKYELLRAEKLDANRRKMKDELERAEQSANLNTQNAGQRGTWARRHATESSDRFGADLERLRQEGAQKRREYEKQYLSKFQKDEPLSKRHKSPTSVSHVDSTVKIRWKIKEGISDLFNADILSGIMGVFGKVESAEILPRSKDARYDTGLVTFKLRNSALEATSHDYSRKSDKWEGTSYRKLSGLLREVKWNKSHSKSSKDQILNKDELSFEEYMDSTLMKLKDAKDHKTLQRKINV